MSIQHSPFSRRHRIVRPIGLLFLFASAVFGGSTVDTIYFGATDSERVHALSEDRSEVIQGALGQSARQLLPKEPVQIDGGSLTFTMKVDPDKRNYVTAKFWADDDNSIDKGRIYLYVIENEKEYQVGYRHEGDYMPLSLSASVSPLPGRFFYSTTILPIPMTKGKTSVVVKLQSTGRLYPFGRGDENHGGNHQFNMKVPSRGIYAAYTHSEPMLDVAGEVHGKPPKVKRRTSLPADAYMGPDGMLARELNRIMDSALKRSPDRLDTNDILCLAKAYSVQEVKSAYRNPKTVQQVIAAIDHFARQHQKDVRENLSGGKGNDGWGGRFGPIGWAIHLLKPQLQKSLDQTIQLEDGKRIKRREAWGDLVIASRDVGRFNRRNLGNQSFYCDISIYMANRGALALGDRRAFPEKEGQRYLREACGIDIYLGSDLPKGGHQMPYGSKWRQVTRKGLTREWGFVGMGYGEMQHNASKFYRMTGNPVFRNQAAKMALARAPFRRPAVEDGRDGNYYQSMEVIGLLAWRGAWESDGNFANGMGYASRTGASQGLYTAAATMHPALIGYAKQMLDDDNQFFHQEFGEKFRLSGPSLELLSMFDDYRAIAAAPDSGIRLPMTPGQPDFVWSDEENGIVAIKRGEQRLWLSTYWQAKYGTGINRVGRFHYSTLTYDQYGTLETEVEFTPSGETYVRPLNNIYMPERSREAPPNPPLNAYGGEILPLAKWPADASNRDPFIGRTDFSSVRFGDWLIGINGTENKTFALKVPGGISKAMDLVTNQYEETTATVGPLQTVILELPRPSK